MKVYCVWVWDYGAIPDAGNTLYGIYDTRELAESVRAEFLKRSPQFQFDYVVVTEQEASTKDDM